MSRRPLDPEVSAACLVGHFPGRPVLPGVVLVRAALDAAGLVPPLELLQAKFLQPCTPQMALAVAWRQRGRRVDLRIEHGQTLMASLSVRLPDSGGGDGTGGDGGTAGGDAPVAAGRAGS